MAELIGRFWRFGFRRLGVSPTLGLSFGHD
jgi:hypothetical protein